MLQAQGSTNKRPDGLLYKPKNGNSPAGYWIIEVKTCRDSDPTGQQSKAEAYQHQVLIDTITQRHRPHCQSMVLSSACRSCRHNIQQYHHASPSPWIGIKGQALKKCISEVHTAAVESLYSRYTTKRKLEVPKEPQWHKRNYKAS